MSVKVHILWTNHYRIYFWCQNFWNSFLAQYFLEHALKLYFLAEIARNVYTSCQDINLATLFHFPNLWTLRVAAPNNLLLITHDIFTSTWQICIILSKQDIHIYWPMMSPWIWKKWWFEIHEINTLEINIDILFSFGFNNVDFTSAKIVKICIKCSNLRCMELNEKKLMG